MRCHSQLTLSSGKDVPLADIRLMIAADNAWVKVIPDTRESSSGPQPVNYYRFQVGRLRGGRNTVLRLAGQLLWGRATEPLRPSFADSRHKSFFFRQPERLSPGVQRNIYRCLVSDNQNRISMLH
jgi:hypothetical protein